MRSGNVAWEREDICRGEGCHVCVDYTRGGRFWQEFVICFTRQDCGLPERLWLQGNHMIDIPNASGKKMNKDLGVSRTIFFTVLALWGLLSCNSLPLCASERIETTFYPNGQVECETPYRGGTPEGKETCFYESGIRKSEALYTNGTERLFTWFAPDGVPLMSMEYDADHNLVQTKTWYASGEVKNVTTYRNGVRHGMFTEYHKDGTVKSEILYENDRPVAP